MGNFKLPPRRAVALSVSHLMSSPIFQPRYTGSRALIIGIDEYIHATPLGYAVSDARAVAEILCAKFGFPVADVTCLYDAGATRQAIISSFLSLTRETTVADDRLLVFFAGHGCTTSGHRGEVGYLVPADGDPKDLSTLIRWDELTRNADLITAKHILFVMDACYGGLAITRAAPYGMMRFVNDMLQRFARQVLTAGKANEVVADSGGPRPEHSVFTGHFLDALDGAAATEEGVITANSVMAYVYNKVAMDQYSRQSPHYGFLDGDGDFVFASPTFHHVEHGETIDSDLLVPVPASVHSTTINGDGSITEKVKDFLCEPRYRIRLDDLIGVEVRKALARLDQHQFPLSGPHPCQEDAVSRLLAYDQAIEDLIPIAVLIGRWADESQRHLLGGILARFVERHGRPHGLIAWIGLAWMPEISLFVAGGISSLSQDHYATLSALFLARVPTPSSYDKASDFLALVIADAMLKADRGDAFKLLPGHEKQFTPRSEYLYKALQPRLEDHLFLGRSYETLFDRFEILFALVVADLKVSQGERAWAPLGRFAWKHRNEHESPLNAILHEAERDGDAWVPLRAGFFGGSFSRFQAVAQHLKGIITALSWY